MSKQYIAELDSVRAIAAISVVIYHYFYRYFDIYGAGVHSIQFLYYLKHGVELFFIVSGFVIYMTLEKIKSPLDFIVSRFSRLYPIYWICVVITFITVFIFGLPGREVTLSHALMNFLMFHEYLKIPHVDGVYWTLTVELTFYFWIFIFYIFSILDKFRLIMMLTVILSAFCSSIGYPFNKFLFRALQLDFMPFFIAGITFYSVWKQKTVNKIDSSYLVLLVILFAYQYAVIEFFIFLILFILFYLLVLNKMRWLAVTPLMKAGAASYSLYLIHQNIGYIIINKLSFQLGSTISALMAMFFTVIFALLLQKYIEKPSINAIRRAYENNVLLSRLRLKWRPIVS